METVVAVAHGDVDRISGASFGESREEIDAVVRLGVLQIGT